MLLFAEVIRVDLFYYIRIFSCNPDIMIHHHFAQLFPIDQDYFLSNPRDVVLSIRRKMRGRNKDALVGTITLTLPQLRAS